MSGRRSTSRTAVHLHGGPKAGLSLIIHKPLPPVLFVGNKGQIERPLQLVEPRPHCYVQDANSAGGRCYDWME